MEKSQNRKPFQALRDLFHPVDLTHGTCWRTILQFSLPVILSYLLQQVYTISDAAIVGQTLTAQEVAGVNDTSSLVFIFLQFAFGVSAGFCVITSCCVGCRDQAGVRRSMAAQLVLSAGLTVLLTALALVLLDPMLAWINVTPENPEVYRAAGEVPCRLPLPGLRLSHVAAVAQIIEEAVQIAVDVRLSRQSCQT